jgi:hypothetical protein
MEQLQSILVLNIRKLSLFVERTALAGATGVNGTSKIGRTGIITTGNISNISWRIRRRFRRRKGI